MGEKGVVVAILCGVGIMVEIRIRTWWTGRSVGAEFIRDVGRQL